MNTHILAIKNMINRIFNVKNNLGCFMRNNKCTATTGVMNSNAEVLVARDNPYTSPARI